MLLFFQKAVPASQSDVALSIAGYTGETVAHADDPEYYRHAEAVLTDTPTAGSIVITLYKNGSSLLDTISLSSSCHRAAVALDLPMSTGDRLQVKATTGSLAPTTADLLVIVS
jgi:hypothetical protein